MVSQLCPGVYTKPGLYTWIYGPFEIFFKENFDYLRFSLYVLTLETNFLQEVRWNFTLGGVGGRGSREADMQILPKSYRDADTGKKEATNLNFCVPSLATPTNLGKEAAAYKTAQRLRASHSLHPFLKAWEMQWPGTSLAPPLMTPPDLVLQSLAPALGMPPFAPDMPPASPTAICLKDQRPLLHSLVQAL